MPMTEDNAAFLDTAEHAVNALLGGVEVVGFLDAGFDNAPVAGFGPAGSSPSFYLPATSVPARPEGLSLAVTSGPCAGNTYKVGWVNPDATGWATLHLIT
ncbi:MAG: hypothetical protein V4706_01620 [Pseudomonadota bacterium]